MDRVKNFSCQKHEEANNELQFICLNEILPEGISRFLCQFCLEDANNQNLTLVSFDRLKQNTRIVSNWPPLHQPIKQSKANDYNSVNTLIHQIEQFYNNLKQNVCEILEEKKKKEISLFNEKAQKRNNLIKMYNQISGFDEISNILLQNDLTLQNFQTQVNNLIKQKYQQIDENQNFINKNVIDDEIQIIDEGSLSKQKKEILQKVSALKIILLIKDNLQFNNFVQCQQDESKYIDILRIKDRILIQPTKSLSGQVYSKNPLQKDQIYQIMIGFNKKPSNYICIGFEEEAFLNRNLGYQGKNSFIFGQMNSSFINKLVKGNKTLQQQCEEQFVDRLIIEVKLQDNQFFIADYPNKSYVVCMDTSRYKFNLNQNYYFTVQISGQDTQIEIISSQKIDNFTLI